MALCIVDWEDYGNVRLHYFIFAAEMILFDSKLP